MPIFTKQGLTPYNQKCHTIRLDPALTHTHLTNTQQCWQVDPTQLHRPTCEPSSVSSPMVGLAGGGPWHYLVLYFARSATAHWLDVFGVAWSHVKKKKLAGAASQVTADWQETAPTVNYQALKEYLHGNHITRGSQIANRSFQCSRAEISPSNLNCLVLHHQAIWKIWRS